MRIESPTPTSLPLCVSSKEITQKPQLNSLQSMSNTSSWMWNFFYFLKRKAWNFLRAIFSHVFPIQQRERVDAAEITLSKQIEKNGEVVYKILLNGFGTSNELRFSKDEGSLILHNVTLLDSEMEEHIGKALREIMRKENSDSIGAREMQSAQLLRKWGFTTSDTISYDLKKTDEKNSEIRRVLKRAKGLEETLNEFYKTALQRLEEDLKRLSLLGSIASSFLMIDNNMRDLSITSILILTEHPTIGPLTGVDIGKVARFNADAICTEVGEFAFLDQSKMES